MKTRTTRARSMPRSSYAPFPELVEPGPHDGSWVVADSRDQLWLPTNGATDKLGKRIFVPLAAGYEGVSLHELAHVKWSPDRFPRVRHPLICLQAVEDARINLGLRKVGFPFCLDREQLAHVTHLAAQDTKSGHVGVALLRAIASLGTDAAPALRAEIEALSPRLEAFAMGWLGSVESRLIAASERVGEPVAPFRVARQIAKDLAKSLRAHGLLDEHSDVAGLGCCHVALPGEGGEGPVGGELRGLSRFERMLRRERERGRAPVESGRMKIVRPALTVRQPAVVRGGVARSRCRSEGSRLERPDRYAVDRAIFSATGRSGGGTVLVDMSGSMSISVEQVEAIVRAAGGAAVVALYSGSGDVGELRIVASGARRATNGQFEAFGSGNVIDLPALEWLAKQPSPRCWVSDGMVTGQGDEGCETLLERCRVVQKRAGIQRVDDAEEAIEALS